MLGVIRSYAFNITPHEHSQTEPAILMSCVHFMLSQDSLTSTSIYIVLPYYQVHQNLVVNQFQFYGRRHVIGML